MKFNWGWGILLTLILFIVFIVNLVYKCTQVDFDLVADNYYEKEIRYQQHIDKEENALGLRQDLVISREDGSVKLTFPPGFSPENLSGSIHFFRPDDASLDFLLDVNPDAELTQLIPVSELRKGWWEIKVDWNSGSTGYFKSEKIRI